jgi:hypothetical protein
MWEEIVFVAFVVIAVLVFLRLSSVRYRGKAVVGLWSRIVISFMFPVIGFFIVFLGSVLIIMILGFVALLFLLALIFFLVGNFKIVHERKKFSKKKV